MERHATEAVLERVGRIPHDRFLPEGEVVVNSPLPEGWKVQSDTETGVPFYISPEGEKKEKRPEFKRGYYDLQPADDGEAREYINEQLLKLSCAKLLSNATHHGAFKGAHDMKINVKSPMEARVKNWIREKNVNDLYRASIIYETDEEIDSRLQERDDKHAHVETAAEPGTGAEAKEETGFDDGVLHEKGELTRALDEVMGISGTAPPWQIIKIDTNFNDATHPRTVKLYLRFNVSHLPKCKRDFVLLELAFISKQSFDLLRAPKGATGQYTLHDRYKVERLALIPKRNISKLKKWLDKPDDDPMHYTIIPPAPARNPNPCSEHPEAHAPSARGEPAKVHPL